MPIRPENKRRYPADWALRSRFVRFYRAGNRCEWCGAENYKPHPVTGSRVILTCAHVYDHRPEAAALLNLAALCQRCHNRHDAPRRAACRRERDRGNAAGVTYYEKNPAFLFGSPHTLKRKGKEMATNLKHKPRTAAAAEAYSYGAAADYPLGNDYKPGCCAAEVEDRRGYRQCTRPALLGPGGLYCYQHVQILFGGR